MTVKTFYVVVSDDSHMPRVRQSPPSLGPREVAIRLKVKFPESRRVIPEIEVTLPELEDPEVTLDGVEVPPK
jgi:hypothetical protein